MQINIKSTGYSPGRSTQLVKRTKKFASAMLACLSLISCGGGGGSGGGTNNPQNNSAPIINIRQIGPNLTLGTTYSLDATGTVDPDGDSLTYQWKFSATPSGRAPEIRRPNSSTADLVLHRSGAHTVTLRVSDGKTTSERLIALNGVYQNDPYFIQLDCEPMALSVGDINNDGLKDIAVLLRLCDPQAPNFDTWLQVLQQNLDGSFSEIHFEKLNLGLFANSIRVGDVNNDGRDDIIVPGANAVLVYYQQSSSTLGARITYASSFTNNTSSYTQPSLIQLLDANGDGRTDVVALQGSIPRSAFELYYQNSGGTFDPPVTFPITGNGYWDMQVGDLNGDGRSDIAFSAGGFERMVSINYQSATGGFLPEVLYQGGLELDQGTNTRILGNEGIAIGDVSGDGRDDLVMSHQANSPDSYISVGYQNPSAQLLSPDAHASFDLPDTVRVGDINGDGASDVVVLHDGWDSIGIYMQDSGQLLSESLYFYFPTASSRLGHDNMVIVDINNDGFNDVLLTEPADGIWVWLGDQYFGN